MSFGALDVGDYRRAAVLAVHEVESARVPLQMQSKLNQAHYHWIKLAAASGEHVFVASALPRRLIGLLSQDPGIDELFETCGRDLFGDAGSLCKIFESPGSPECLTKKHQRRARSNSFQCAFNRAELKRARSVTIGETTRQCHRVSGCIHVTRIAPDITQA